MMLRLATRALLTAATLLAGACGTADRPAAAAAQGSATLVAVSDYTNAGYNDVAVGRDGVIHAVWQDMPPGVNHYQIFYSASRDGMRWSDPVALSEPGENATQVRVAMDEQGRLYALWKTWNGGISSGPELNPTNTLGSIFGSLRYRVLEGGRWSEAVAVGRENNVFAFFPSVDPRGGVHVVWSENSNPELQAATPWPNWANTIWQAELNGVGSNPIIVTDDPDVGFHGLDGFVDEAGHAQFVAIGGSRLLYWNENQFATLLEGLTGDTKDAARLLRDGHGNEHLIFYRADAEAIADLPGGEGAQPRIAFQAPAGGRIVGFQACQGTNGEIILAVEVEQASRTADLYVMSSHGTGWSAPVNVTGNAAGEQGAGYVGPGGNRLVGGVAWSAKYASAAVEPSGALALLVTNLRSTTSTRSDMLEFRGGWSYPQVYFTRLGGDIAASDAPPPAVTAVTDGAAPTRPADPVTPGPAPTPVPGPRIDPTPVPASGLPVGQYQCHYVSQYAGPIPTGVSVSILAGGRYQSFDGQSGTYSFDPASESVQWTSGPFAGGGVTAEFYRGDDGKPTIEVVTGDPSSDPSQQNFCVLSQY